MKKMFLPAVGMMLMSTFTHATQTWWMRGGNWGDGRDNYQDGWIIPSELSSNSSIADCETKAVQVANDIKGIGGSVVRLAINPPSVANATWWGKMKAYINKLKASGCNVVLGCWESNSGKDGKIDNYNEWKTMWQSVDATYKNDSSVWFEPLNEPFAYSALELKNIYKDYLSFISKSDGRIILPGRSYSEWVGEIANDSAFNSCKFGVHIYGWWDRTEAGFGTELANRVGGYADRTLITEMGAPATTGKNYGTSTPSDRQINYIRGVTQKQRDLQIGGIYWPSHRNGDSYRLFNNVSGGGITNTSLKNRIRYGWNL